MCHVFYCTLPEINCSPFTVGEGGGIVIQPEKEEGSADEGGAEGKGVAFC